MKTVTVANYRKDKYYPRIVRGRSENPVPLKRGRTSRCSDGNGQSHEAEL